MQPGDLLGLWSTGAACDEVNAQTGKHISAAQAASFIAQAIEATLGC